MHLSRFILNMLTALIICLVFTGQVSAVSAQESMAIQAAIPHSSSAHMQSVHHACCDEGEMLMNHHSDYQHSDRSCENQQHNCQIHCLSFTGGPQRLSLNSNVTPDTFVEDRTSLLYQEPVFVTTPPPDISA